MIGIVTILLVSPLAKLTVMGVLVQSLPATAVPSAGVNITLTAPSLPPVRIRLILAVPFSLTLQVLLFKLIVPGTIQFSNTAYSVNENGTPVTAVTLNRTGGSDGGVSVTVNLTNGTATAGSDYNNSPITVNFADGETTKTVTIPVANDTLIESTETFNLTLSNPTGGVTINSTKNTTTVSILDDDVQLSFGGIVTSDGDN